MRLSRNLPSPRRKSGSSPRFWIPAFAGMTAFILGLAATAGAVDLVTHGWPMTSQIYDHIDLNVVRYDGLRTFTEWLRIVADQNPEVSKHLIAEPVMAFDIRIDEDESSQPTLESFVEEARERAAKIGANLIFTDEAVKEPDGERGYV